MKKATINVDPTYIIGEVSPLIFGGFIDPEITGYDIHKNIYIKHTNSPCGSKNKCDHCSECMNLITVDLIKEEVDSVLI